MIDKKNEHHKRSSSESFRISQKKISWMLSAAVLIIFFVFMTGYFLGQQRALDLFTQKIEQESLADQIYSSLCVLYDNDEDLEASTTVDLLPQAQDDNSSETQASISDEQLSPEQMAQQDVQDEPNSLYYAQLIGFGTHKAAERFVARLAQRGIKANSKKRQSKTAGGKVRYWYQVVTDVYEDKRELEIVVNSIKNSEKINDIRIITC